MYLCSPRSAWFRGIHHGMARSLRIASWVPVDAGQVYRTPELEAH